MTHLIQADVKMMRKRYDEALKLQGIPCIYQFPNLANSNVQGEAQIDSYSEEMPAFVFFDGNPKVKTFKRYGWVVENDTNLPFLIHCSFELPHLQKDSIFKLSGQYTDLPDRTFRVTEISYDLQAPDHLVCQVIPVFDTQYVGRTETEVKQTFNTSNHFFKGNTDYRGNIHVTHEQLGEKQ